jgi:cobalt-zinc-cadmium efflux system membrane fusion protein
MKNNLETRVQLHFLRFRCLHDPHVLPVHCGQSSSSALKLSVVQWSLLGLFCLCVLVLSSCSFFIKNEKSIQREDPEIIKLSSSAIKTNKINYVTAKVKSLKIPIESTATLRINENSLFKANSIIMGLVIQDNVNLGDKVYQGETLALIQNPEIAKLQSTYVHEFHLNEVETEQANTRLSLALENLEREKKLFEEGISPKKDYIQAEADYRIASSELTGKVTHKKHLNSESRALLSAYNLNPRNVKSGIINANLPITAARSGIVIKKNISLGSLVNPDTVMYEIADLSELWLDINIHPKSIDKVKIGQKVTFKTAVYPDKKFNGIISYIQQVSFTNTGIYVARAILDNPSGILLPGLVGEALIETNQAETKVCLPDSCIQQYGKEFFVFEKLSKNRFRKRTVELGSFINDAYLINSGVEANMKIVSEGSFLLKAELLKSLSGDEE